MKKKFKFALITAAFAVLILIVLTNVFKMTQVSDKDFKTYRQGLSYLNQKDYQNAYFNFANVSKNSAIYEIALLRQATCADELEDFDTASKKYRLFIEKFPDSIFIQKAYYALAQNYFKAKDYNKAEKTLFDIRKNFKDSEYKIASDYYLGEIYKIKAEEKLKESEEKDTRISIINIVDKDNKDTLQLKEKAKTHFSQYLEFASGGRFALISANEMFSLDEPLAQKDYYLAGKTYFKNGMYKKALESFNNSSMSSSWGYLSEIYRKQGNYTKYRNLFEQNYPLYSKNIDEEELLSFLENYAKAYPYGEKAGWEKLLNLAKKEFAKDCAVGCDFIMYKLAKLENQPTKNNLYTKIYQNFSSGKFASESLATLFWDAYSNRRYKEAYSLGVIHARDYQGTLAAPRILFWMGKLDEKQGRHSEARGFYQRVVDNYPDSYYAFRASKHLSNAHNKGWKTKSSHRLPEKTPVMKFPLSFTTLTEDNVSLINTILKLNDYKLLGELDKENKAIQSWINYKEGNYSTSALQARDAIEKLDKKPAFSNSIYRLAYPLHYQETINDTAAHYRLDPYLVTALIREESYFNPEAGSSAGAMGLMQLMPYTASHIAARNGIRYSGASSLYDPQKNIELGCAYLDYAKEVLYEDDLLAVASYNSGPNAVKTWKNKLSYKNFDEFIENIPYPETKDYVKKVYRSYWVYINIY